MSVSDEGDIDRLTFEELDELGSFWSREPVSVTTENFQATVTR